MHRHLLPTALSLLIGLPAAADELFLEATLDNTLYEDPEGALSNGQGQYLFAGRTYGDVLRRALVAFDVAGAIPPGSTVTGADLRLWVSKATAPVPAPSTVHRLLATWGEGASDAPGEEGQGTLAVGGDATWIDRFTPGVAWTTAGGDFVAAPSALTSVPPSGSALWTSTPELVADVQAWVDGAENAGWVVLGPEPLFNFVRRYWSRQAPEPTLRPTLRVVFEPPTCPLVLPSAEAVRLGSPPNPPALLPGATSGPVIGQTWDPRIDHATFTPGALADVLALSALATNLDLGPAGTALCGPTDLLLFVAPAPGQAFAVTVPDQCGIVGVTLCAQGASVDALGGLALTNALDLTLGSF